MSIKKLIIWAFLVFLLTQACIDPAWNAVQAGHSLLFRFCFRAISLC